MQIKVDSIQEIAPCTKHGDPMISLDLCMDGHLAKDIFYQLWEVYGDDNLNQWLTEEGYSLIKRNEMVTHTIYAWAVRANKLYFVTNSLGRPTIFRTRKEARARASEINQYEGSCIKATACRIRITIDEIHN